MTEEIINKEELKNLRFLLQSGQKLAISTKEFERVFDKIDRLEQENKELKEKFKQVFNIDNQECWNIAFLNDEKEKYRSALKEINRIVKLAHKVEDYLLGQDYTDLVDRLETKIKECIGE